MALDYDQKLAWNYYSPTGCRQETGRSGMLGRQVACFGERRVHNSHDHSLLKHYRTQNITTESVL